MADGDLYPDYGGPGKEPSRPGFDALFRRVEADRRVTHVYTTPPRRDRFARPDDHLDAMLLERKLRNRGLTPVYTDRVARPIRPGPPNDPVGDLLALLDFHAAGSFRPEHARKSLCARGRPARDGFSGGGTPPYGFDRRLVREAGDGR